MNILYLAHRIPFPPNKGDKLRAFRQLEFLSRNHRVWCACFIDDPRDLRHIATLRTHCHQLGTVRLRRTSAMLRGLTGLAKGGSFTESFYTCRQMRRLIHDWSAETPFDAVVAFSSSMAEYALTVPAARRILDLCDLDSQKWNDYAQASPFPLSRLYLTESRRLAAREHDWVSRFDACTLITLRESELLPAGLRSRVHVVANGVSALQSPIANRQSPMPLGGMAKISMPQATQRRHAAPGRLNPPRELNLLQLQSPISNRQSPIPIIGFLGQMNYKPNVDAVCWFARKCWPLIRLHHPTAVFRLAGRQPTRAVRRLAGIPGIEVLGEVADAAATVAAFDVFVAPLHIARGLPNKVLEAMAAGKPVVTTTAVAAALQLTHDVQAFIGDTPEAFSAATIRLIADPELRFRLGAAGRDFVIGRYDWQRELSRFELIVTGETSPRSMPQPQPPCRLAVVDFQSTSTTPFSRNRA